MKLTDTKMNKKETGTDGMMTVDEAIASGALPFCGKTVLRLIRSGRLKAVNVGAGKVKARWRVRLDDVREFMRSQKAGDK